MDILHRMRGVSLSARTAPRFQFFGWILFVLAFPASSAVIFEEDFSGGENFTSVGRANIGNGYARLRGGSITSITSLPIATTGFSNLSLAYSRDTFGLDSAETFSAEISVNGGPFTLLESLRDASGRVSFAIPEPSNSIQLRFSISASSYFERADLADLVVEGEGESSCVGEECCEPNCEEPPGDERVTLIPDSSWDCGLPGGIPDPESGDLLFTVILPFNNSLQVGHTPYGLRTVRTIGGGNLANASGGLNGEILSGSLDFDLALPSGALEHESRYTIRTNNGSLIYMRNCGIADGDKVRFVADFEAPNNSTYTWLHQGTYVGIRELTSAGVRLSVYRNPSHGGDDDIVQTPSDNGLRQQSWDCPALPAGADSGDEILRARVNIGGFQSIGNSKNGSRRIIPITGGSFSGDIAGGVNPGGADYQLTVNGELALEARYTLQTSDGETIVVRNCGDYANSSLTLPIFEASTSGNYDWLNDREFVGTITPGFGRVTITVYERE